MKLLDTYAIPVRNHIRNTSHCPIAFKKIKACESLLTYSETQIEHIKIWAETASHRL